MSVDRASAVSLAERMLAWPRSFKRWIQALYDFLLLMVCLYAAYVLRMETFLLREPLAFAIAAPTIAAVGVASFERLGFYRALVRYGETREILVVLGGTLAAAVVLSLMAWTREIFVPRSVPALFMLIAVPFVVGTRVILRNTLFLSSQTHKPHVAIYGAGSAGRELAHALRIGTDYQPVFFIDDDPALRGNSVAGLLVYGPEAISQRVTDHEICRLFLAIPSASAKQKREVLQKLITLPVPVMTVPSVTELLSGRLSISALREVSVSDLLGREPIAPYPEWMDADIHNKVVMITGAGGSIGSELCRLALARRPQALVLYELSELALYQIEAELLAMLKQHSMTTSIYACLGSVRDASKISHLLKKHGIQTIYHAAAYKHVPLVEVNIEEGLLNNVQGTETLALCAIAANVSKFVLVSTDKAVRPTSVMGASKRLAELICQALAEQQSATRFLMVRFGNVLDSSGSVVPLFRRQIQMGGPVTVTDPNVTRYFMTIREAAELVIQSGAMGKNGEVCVLDMGDPVKVIELARRMIQLSGLRVKESSDDEGIEIVFSGLRPGEKLYEELLISEATQPTPHPRIRACKEPLLPWPELSTQLLSLYEACEAQHPARIRTLLQALPLYLQAAHSGIHGNQTSV